MSKFKISEETRLEIILVTLIFGIPIAMFLINYYFLGGDTSRFFVEKGKEKTVIVTQAKQGDPLQKPPTKAVVDSVREAIKKGNYSTAYMQINSVAKNSPESDELRKQLAEDAQKRKTPGVRKEAGALPTAPVRYLDESTPRDRSTDAIYIYFVDVSGMLLPHFCIQAASKRKLGVNGFTITADNKKMEIIASPIKLENVKNGVAEWYDVPLDRHVYEVVQTMAKAKKVTLTVSGSNGNKTRDVTESEIKGFSNIIAGYTALGGNLNYLQTIKPLPPPSSSTRK